MFQIRNITDFTRIKTSGKLSINLQDPLNNTLLHISTINNNLELTRTILENGANYKLINANGLCPLFYIKSKDMLEIYLDTIGSEIFTVFNNGKNITSIKFVSDFLRN